MVATAIAILFLDSIVSEIGADFHYAIAVLRHFAANCSTLKIDAQMIEVEQQNKDIVNDKIKKKKAIASGRQSKIKV